MLFFVLNNILNLSKRSKKNKKILHIYPHIYHVSAPHFFFFFLTSFLYENPNFHLVPLYFWLTFFNISYNTNLLVMNSLSVYISDKFYITSVLKMFLRGIEFQVNTSVCLFKSLMRLFPCLLDYILLMKSLLSFLSLFLCVSYLPSLASFKFFSSSLVFSISFMVCVGQIFLFSCA